MGSTLFFSALLCCFSFHVFVASAATTSTNTSTPDHAASFLVNCGASGSSSDGDGRTWVGDVESNFSQSSLKSTSTDTAKNLDEVPSTPYSNARFFTSNFTYSFPVSPGRYFIRLHFNPTNYTNHTDYLARFSVTSSGNLTLLKNFSSSQTGQVLNTSQTAQARNEIYLIREFSIVVSNSSKMLSLTFAPSSNLPNSYAFVNGIEIVSVPGVIFDPKTDTFAPTGQQPTDPLLAVETAYRLNVGGDYISPVDDSGLFREWYVDNPYIYDPRSEETPTNETVSLFGVMYSKDANVTINMDKIPSYTAPMYVYGSARSIGGSNGQLNLESNLTWAFLVDSGFDYMVRLHFCEIINTITKRNERVFDIFIQNQIVTPAADVIALSGGIGNPTYKDYSVPLPEGSSQQYLSIALRPYTTSKPELYDVLLNGLEIFKISSNGSLAGPSPNKFLTPEEHRRRVPVHLALVGGLVGGGIALVLLFLFTIYCMRRRRRLMLDCPSTNRDIGIPSGFCQRFTFVEMSTATNGFNKNRILGVGGFGIVYRGKITTESNGHSDVAIKRSNPKSVQGIVEFQTELEMLSKLRHRHLVSLIGYCHEKGEMILVYDYMANGTFREHLYKTKNPPLPWTKRLEICIGAARGLHYLHTGGKHTIIHRDVKTTNILLDENWVAKVSDFGLSKTDQRLDQKQTISTAIKGSFGYMDPEYIRRWQLSEKSDVYSFGVVLFEVLCGRPPVDSNLPEEQVNLADWVLECRERGVLDQIVDPILKGEIETVCQEKFVEIAVKCLGEKWIDRPNMTDVLWGLELALELQESAGGRNSNTLDREDNDHIALVSITSETDGMTTSGIISVFSDTRNKKGR